MYHGWRIVAALFVILVFTSGLGFYNHSVLLQALIAERGLSVTTSSTAVSIFFFASGLAGLVIAPALDRLHVRTVVIAGACLAAASLFAIGHVTSEAQVFVAYAVFGVGFAASGLLPATTLVTRWFERRRAMAMSLASTGLSVGGVVVTPVSAILVENVGITEATYYLAAAYLLGVIPFCLMLVSSPRDVGLAIDGARLVDGAAGVPERGTSFSEAVRGWYFWALGFAYLFLMMAQVGGIAHQYGIISQHLSGETAALALGVIPVFSILGRLAGGVLIDAYPVRTFTLVMMAMQSASLVTLGLSSSLAGFLAALALFGITIGNLLMLQPLLIAAAYGPRSYSRLFSVANLMSTLGVAGGPLIVGLLFERLGDYDAAYVVAGVAGLVGFLFYLSSRYSLPVHVEPRPTVRS